MTNDVAVVDDEAVTNSELDTTASEEPETEPEQKQDSEPQARTRPRAETRQEAIHRLQIEIHPRIEELRQAQNEASDASEQLKAAKKKLELAQSYLNGTVLALDSAIHSSEWQPALPFGQDDDEDVDSDDSGITAESDPDTQTPSPPSGKDPAIEASIAELKLTLSVTDKLLNADIETIAELEQAMAADRLRKVKGIGGSAIDKISDAVIAWRQVAGYGGGN